MFKKFCTSSLIFGFFLVTLFFAVKTAKASEGTIELRSTGVEPYRCYAASLRMLEPEFRILFSCKFILYPADENIFNYVLWATPVEGRNAIKLGLLGQGRGEFRTKSAFTNLFVTTEENRDTRTPQGKVVMRGNVEPIGFLVEADQYEPTPTISADDNAKISPSTTGTQVKATDPTTQTTGQKILTAFKRAGVAALIAIVALVGLIFVITRSRG